MYVYLNGKLKNNYKFFLNHTYKINFHTLFKFTRIKNNYIITNEFILLIHIRISHFSSRNIIIMK